MNGASLTEHRHFRPHGVRTMTARMETLQEEHAELLAVKERLTLAVEASGLAVWDWDVPTGLVRFQPHITHILGYPSSFPPSTHQQGRDLTHPDDLAAYDEALRTHAREKTPHFETEMRLRHADGNWRWIHCRGKIISRAEDGTSLRIVGTFADVTAKKEEAADREFLSTLTNSLMQASQPESIISIAVQRLAKYLMAERVGISELTEEGTSFLTRAVWSHKSLPTPPPEHRHAYSAKIIEEVSTKGPFVVEDVQTDPRSKGSPTAALYAKMDIRSLLNIPMQADGRSPVFLYVHARKPRKWTDREINLCEQVAERLWNSIHRASAEGIKDSADELLNMALSVARLGVFERDIKSGAIRLSDGFFELIGHPELASGSLLEYQGIIHPDDRDRFATKISEARTRRLDYELNDEHRIITAQGDVRHIRYRSRVHFEPDDEGINRLAHAAAVIQDVTDEKEQAEEAAMVRDRLYKMSRLTAMGTMASTLAHELNQPLTAAVNYLNVLRTLEKEGRAVEAAERSQVLDLSVRSVLDAGKIIRKIRTFTSGGGVQRKSVQLSDIVSAAVRNVMDQAGRQKPEIVLDLPDRLLVTVDEMQIEQVLSNLIRNAAEAMTRQKNAKITLSAREQGGFVDLHVTDNGPGIADDFASGLFNPFQSSKRDGMGLGLSLCRTMVEAHGGHLTLEKHDKTGCDFLIRLPKTTRRVKST